MDVGVVTGVGLSREVGAWTIRGQWRRCSECCGAFIMMGGWKGVCDLRDTDWAG